MLFNRRESPNLNWAKQSTDEPDHVIDNFGVIQPTRYPDGIWVFLDHGSGGSENFDDPFNTLAAGLANTPSRARVRIKGSATGGAGTIGQRVELHAALGSAIIGQ